MPEELIIERLEFRGRCGVTQDERARPQPLAVDVRLEYQWEPSGRPDDLAHTVDYAKIAQRVVDVGTEKDANLLETVAERLLAMLFQEFPVTRVRLWIRKLHPPMNLVTGSVGVSMERTKADQHLRQSDPAPARFLVQQLPRLPRGSALDLAAGSGRNALFLASQGYQVTAVDRDADALHRLSSAAQRARLAPVQTTVMDLEPPTPCAPDLGHNQYEVIIVFFYLHRSLFPLIIEALKPGGVLIYETFTIENYFHHRHPRRWEFCLAHNELLRLTSALHVLHYDEGEHEGTSSAPSFTARLAAQKPPHQGPPA